MDEQEFADGRLAAIYLEASFLHERALAACMEELGDSANLADARVQDLLQRSLLHAERAAACAADAANAAESVEGVAVARRSLVIDRLAVLALRGLLGEDRG